MCNTNKLCVICSNPVTHKSELAQTCSKKCSIIFSNQKRKYKKQEWAKQNLESVIRSKQKWLTNNPEKRKIASDSYRKRNKEYYAHYASLRSRYMRQAQPAWANVNDIIDVYKEASYFGLEVDHIIPIKHELVCGLHVWNNLQLLSRTENAKKSNSFFILSE